MKNITFDNIYTLGHIISETNQYRHYHYPEMPIRYDSNLIEFKVMPTLAEFKEVEVYLREFHLKHDQKHLKFCFPENEKPVKGLMDYLEKTGYDVGFLELYAIKPVLFPQVSIQPEIEVEAVTEANLEVYLKLQYETDLQFGTDFAEQKIAINKRNFADEAIMQIIAYYQGKPVGSVDVIITETTAEIDGLAVKESYRNRGIGSRLQKCAMDTFADRIVILVADGEDTPREMYRRQNYQYVGFRYEALKV